LGYGEYDLKLIGEVIFVRRLRWKSKYGNSSRCVERTV